MLISLISLIHLFTYSLIHFYWSLIVRQGISVLIMGLACCIAGYFERSGLVEISDNDLSVIFGSADSCSETMALGMFGARCAGASNGSNTCVTSPSAVGCGAKACPIDCATKMTVFPYSIGSSFQHWPEADCPDGAQYQCIPSCMEAMPCRCSTNAADLVAGVKCNQKWRQTCGT